MKTTLMLPLFAALIAYEGWNLNLQAQVTVTATNTLAFARASQTLELSASDLASLGEKDLTKIRVKDASGKELLCQAVDTDGDAYRKADIVIFQADFAANEGKKFTVNVGAKWEYKKEQFKAYGRFIRERFDDFAWENDRIAHRTYGKALETWEGEPLCSSTIDMWSKRSPRMLINEWYMTGDYHADHGEGADFYSAGLSRGNGGNGLWSGDQLWVSRNFVSSKVLANGPIRVLFELTYEPFFVNGVNVSEVKRVSLDAGQNLDRYQSTYKQFTKPGRETVLLTGIGVKKIKGEVMTLNPQHGWLTKLEDMEANGGKQAHAVVFDPKSFDKQVEDKLNQLIIAKVTDNTVASYWAGFYWDRSGQFASYDAWKKYVDEFALGAAEPIQVRVEK